MFISRKDFFEKLNACKKFSWTDGKWYYLLNYSRSFYVYDDNIDRVLEAVREPGHGNQWVIEQKGQVPDKNDFIKYVKKLRGDLERDFTAIRKMIEWFNKNNKKG